MNDWCVINFWASHWKLIQTSELSLLYVRYKFQNSINSVYVIVIFNNIIYEDTCGYLIK